MVWLLSVGLAFFFLNSLLTFENHWPGFGVHWRPRLSFELCLGVLALMGWMTWRPFLSSRAATALALGFVLLVAVRYADVTAPAVLGRPVNIYWDGRHAVQLFRMASASLSAWQLAAAACGGIAGGVALLLLVRSAITTLARGLTWSRPRPVLLVTVAALTLSFAAHEPGSRDTRWFFSLPLSPTLLQQAVLLSHVMWPARGEAMLGPGPAFGTPSFAIEAPGQHRELPDVVLLFAESYGAVAYDLPPVATALAGPRAALAQAAAASGRGVVSARVRSPTFGGASWLAHASVLSGLPMSDPVQYELLLASQRPTLVSHFARHGYRTVGWLPGIKHDWPEGAFYGYARLADDSGIGYTGPDFGYWRIPDQAAMALLHDQELARDSATGPRVPRFVVFATTSTHAPFHPLAPLAEDWGRLGSAHPYTEAQAAAALAVPLGVQQALPSYIEGLRYQFHWLASYLQHRAPPSLVLVVVGDHQPPALVSGPGTSWDVPVHVITDDQALLQRLRVQGFADGLVPPAVTLGPMHDLTEHLLRAFAAPGSGTQSAPTPADRSASRALQTPPTPTQSSF